MSIVLFGSQGMLGSELFEVLSETFPKETIIPLARFNGDITNAEWIEKILNEHNAHIVINTAAFTDVDKAEDPDWQDEMNKVNIDAPEQMAKWCQKNNASFFHVSTDFVFSGKKGDIFTEESQTNPLNAYGKSKEKGEQKVRAFSNSCILRTAWLTGNNGHNFVHQMVHLSKNEQTITIVANQWGSPSFVHDVAKSIAALCQNPALHHGQIYHLVNEGVASRKEIVEEIQQFLTLPTQIIEVSTFQTVAKRPECSALKNTKVPKLPHWKDSLHVFLQPDLEKLEEKRRKKLGKNYKNQC